MNRSRQEKNRSLRRREVGLRSKKLRSPVREMERRREESEGSNGPWRYSGRHNRITGRITSSVARADTSEAVPRSRRYRNPPNGLGPRVRAADFIET